MVDGFAGDGFNFDEMAEGVVTIPVVKLGSELASLVAEFIGDLFWTHDVTFTYGPRRVKANKYSKATDSGAIDPQTVRVTAFPIEKALEDGGRKIAMWEIYVPARSITFAPTVEDTATIDGVRCEILACNPLGATGVDAAHIVLARR